MFVFPCVVEIYRIIVFLVLEALPDVFNDLDLEEIITAATSNRYLSDPRNKRKVREYTQSTKINFIHPVRPGKKLVVLDIDYSMFRLTFVC